MADEETIPQGEIESEEPQGEPEETDPIERLAKAMGWNPDHSGDRPFVDAETFIMRSKEINDTMRDQLQSLKRSNTDLTGAMHELKAHYEAMRETERTRFNKEVEQLKKARNRALDEGDAEKVKELDETIDGMEPPREPPKAPVQQQVHPAVIKFMQESTWYNKKPLPTAYANSLAPAYANMDPEEALKEIESEVKKRFPEYFEETKTDTRRPQVPAVEGAARTTPRGKSKKKFGWNDLSDEQKHAAKIYEEQGVMTRDEYIKDLMELGVLEG